MSTTSSLINFNPRTREGCDQDRQIKVQEAEAISIHAPVKGATFAVIVTAQSMGYFNPRTREGCDSAGTGRWHTFYCYFNPRTREGCDPRPTSTTCQTAYFNPRTREGCDFPGHDRRIVISRISIHAPVKGATFKVSCIFK